MLESRLRSLRERTVLFIAGILVLCGFLSVFIISHLVSTQMETQYRSETETSVEYLSTTLVPMIQLQDYPRVERTIESVLVYPYIVAVAVYDEDGALIRSVARPQTRSATFSDRETPRSAGSTSDSHTPTRTIKSGGSHGPWRWPSPDFLQSLR